MFDRIDSLSRSGGATRNFGDHDRSAAEHSIVGKIRWSIDSASAAAEEQLVTIARAIPGYELIRPSRFTGSARQTACLARASDVLVLVDRARKFLPRCSSGTMGQGSTGRVDKVVRSLSRPEQRSHSQRIFGLFLRPLRQPFFKSPALTHACPAYLAGTPRGQARP